MKRPNAGSSDGSKAKNGICSESDTESLADSVTIAEVAGVAEVAAEVVSEVVMEVFAISTGAGANVDETKGILSSPRQRFLAVRAHAKLCLLSIVAER